MNTQTVEGAESTAATTTATAEVAATTATETTTTEAAESTAASVSTETTKAVETTATPEAAAAATTDTATDTTDYKALYEAEKIGTGIKIGVGAKEVRAREAAAVEALIDKSKLSLDANGSIKGLDAEIARVKATFPGLFYSIGNANGGERSESDPAPKNAKDLMASAYADNAAARRGH